MLVQHRVLQVLAEGFKDTGVQVTEIGMFQSYNPYGEMDSFLRTDQKIDEIHDKRFYQALESLWTKLDPNASVQLAPTLDGVIVTVLERKYLVRRLARMLYVQRYMEFFKDTVTEFCFFLEEETCHLFRFPPGKVKIFYSGKADKLRAGLMNLGFVESDETKDLWKNQKGEVVTTRKEINSNKQVLSFHKLLPRLEI